MIQQVEDTNEPEVTRTAPLSMQVCVPWSWKDRNIVRFANVQNPSGTTEGWQINKKLGKVDCENKPGFVHIVLDC